MTREEYIEELRARISHLPKEERESALSYYIEYLEDATDKTMEEIVAELGTPGEVAERIIAECAQSNQERGENAGCLVGALAVLTSPVWLPVLFVIFVVGAVLLFVVMLLIFIFGVVAIALLGAGFWALTAYPPTGIAVLDLFGIGHAVRAAVHVGRFGPEVADERLPQPQAALIEEAFL